MGEKVQKKDPKKYHKNRPALRMLEELPLNQRENIKNTTKTLNKATKHFRNKLIIITFIIDIFSLSFSFMEQCTLAKAIMFLYVIWSLDNHETFKKTNAKKNRTFRIIPSFSSDDKYNMPTGR